MSRSLKGSKFDSPFNAKINDLALISFSTLVVCNLFVKICQEFFLVHQYVLSNSSKELNVY